LAHGYIKLHRQLQNNWLWQERRSFSKAEAWIDILFLVNHQEAKVTLGNELITVGKGSRIISVRQLCERWKWSNTKVKAFLDILVADKMIVYKSDTKKTVITVVNWDLYQCDNDTKTSQKRHDSITDQSQKRTNKNDKNDKNDKNVLSLEIEKFRTRYTPEQLKIINHYFEILRTTRRSGTISDSVICGIYENMDKYDPLIVQYACTTVVNKPELHDKKENYFVGILRNTTIGEAVKTLQGGYRDSFKPFIKDKTALIDSIFDDMEANENG